MRAAQAPLSRVQCQKRHAKAARAKGPGLLAKGDGVGREIEGCTDAPLL